MTARMYQQEKIIEIIGIATAAALSTINGREKR